jgi:alanyl-tRNA synthetase
MNDAAAVYGSTRRLYFEDAYRTEFEARICERLAVEDRPAVVLDRTCFYPESGGQPWDLGTLGGVPVVKVVEEGETIVHVLEKEPAGDEVRGCIDWTRRFDHMQQHTGQHVLSQAFVEVLRGETRSFHLGAEESSLEIGLAMISDESLDRVERRANEVIFENREVKTYFVPPERIAQVPLRRPPKVEGTIRVVEVEGFDYSACGGTHVRRTGEIGLVKVLSAERIRGNLRFTFVCGGRALAAFQTRNRVVRDLVGRFNVQAKDVPASVERLGAELKDLKKSFKRIEEKLAVYEAAEYVSRTDGPVISAILEEKSPDAARALALSVVRRGTFVVCFGVRSETRSHLLVARSESLAVDLRSLVPVVASLLNGKGGGGSSLIEIAGDRDADLAAAVARAVEKIRSLL